MVYIVLTAGILSFLIGIFVLTGNRFDRRALSFASFCFVSSAWIFFNFLTYYTGDSYFLKPVYAFGTLMPGVLLSWTYTYFEKGNANWKHFLIYAIGGGIAVLALFTDKIIAEVHNMTSIGIAMDKGTFFGTFTLYTGSTVVVALIRIFRFWRGAEGDIRKKNFLIFAGSGLFLGVSVFVSVILPTFGIFAFTNLDSPSALFFIIFISVAIYRHNFLGTKLVLAQLLIAAIIFITVVEIFYAHSHFGFVLKIAILIFVVILGVFLIRTIKKENLRKEELKNANKKLRELDLAKSEFISMASHQLRTPLTTMKGFVGLMKKGVYGEMPQNLNEPMNILERANERLITLTEEMLDVSRMELGKAEFNFKKEDINDLVEELYESFDVVARERGVALCLQLGRDVPEIVMDQNKMREAISNLVDNALKYTEKGSVVMQTRHQNDHVIISVKDTGIGISAAERNVLFEKFSRGERARELKKEGVGLGLYMGKKIIEAHKGRIYALPNSNRVGMTFIVKLPISSI